MWLMLQQESPEDYVIGTGEHHSVEEFVDLAFRHVDLDWHDYVEIDPRYYRPAEVDDLRADPSKARKELGWSHSVGFRQLVALMVDAELARMSVSPVLARESRTLQEDVSELFPAVQRGWSPIPQPSMGKDWLSDPARNERTDGQRKIVRLTPDVF
jgi:GDPmannose 4,6-dehydratase